MPKRKDLQLDRYGISKYRYRELYNWCLQYPDWKKEIHALSDALKSPVLTGMPRGGGTADSTAQLALRKAQLSIDCDLVEQALMDAVTKVNKDYNANVFRCTLTAVTNSDITYTQLHLLHDLPCSREAFNETRRCFYCLLDIKRKKN